MGDVTTAADEFVRWMARSRLTPGTQTVYRQHVTRFAAWADEHGPEYAECLRDPDVRDYAARDYRRRLLVTEKKAPRTVAAAMSALQLFFEHVGVGRAEGLRVDVPPSDRTGLDDDDLRKVLRAARRRGPRDNAITHLLYNTAVRVSELHALDTDDVHITERTGVLSVRFGKGGKPRQINVNSDARDALRMWLRERPQVGHAALFTSRRGLRLSMRGVERVLELISDDTGVHVTPHVLRHTYGRRYLAEGGDIVSLALDMGHSSLETTRGYATPTAAQREAATEAVRIEL